MYREDMFGLFVHFLDSVVSTISNASNPAAGKVSLAELEQSELDGGGPNAAGHMASRPAANRPQCTGSTEQRGWATAYSPGRHARNSSCPWPPLLPPCYGFQNGYKMRVYYLVQSNRPGIVSRAATRLVISIERPDPTFPPSSARFIPAATPRRPSPDLGSKPPSAFIPAGGSGRHGRGPSLVTRWRARGSAPISRFSPHTRTGSPRFGSLAVSWVLRLSGQSASRLARLWIRGWRGVVRDRSSSHWAIRELRLLVLFALCFFLCRWWYVAAGFWARLLLTFRGVV